jgi:DNA-binding response OmpR family regulator
VLVVDNFFPLANALVDILATNFYEARAAHSAVEALRIAEEFRPHLLVADVILPDVDGFRFAMEFERRYPGTHVLLASAGYSGSENVKRTASGGKSRAFGRSVSAA